MLWEVSSHGGLRCGQKFEGGDQQESERSPSDAQGLCQGSVSVVGYSILYDKVTKRVIPIGILYVSAILDNLACLLVEVT